MVNELHDCLQRVHRSLFILLSYPAFVVAAKYYTLLNEIVTQLHLGIIHIFTDGMFFIFAAD